MSAGQRDRSAKQSDHRVQVERHRGEEPDQVLHDDERRTDAEKHQQLRTAARQHPHVRTQADGRKEHQQQRVAETHVEGHRRAEQAGQHRQQYGHETAAHHRRRNAESLQQWHPGDQRAANEEHGNRHKQCGDQIQLDLLHASAPVPSRGALAVGRPCLVTVAARRMQLVFQENQRGGRARPQSEYGWPDGPQGHITACRHGTRTARVPTHRRHRPPTH